MRTICSVLLILTLLACASSQKKVEESPTQPAASSENIKKSPEQNKDTQTSNQNASKPPEKMIRYQGICKIMHPPGTTEKLFSPCNKAALMVIYKKGKQAIVSVVRTEENGQFVLELPGQSQWTLASAQQEWQAEVELSRDNPKSPELSVTLKPKKSSEKIPSRSKK